MAKKVRSVDNQAGYSRNIEHTAIALEVIRIITASTYKSASNKQFIISRSSNRTSFTRKEAFLIHANCFQNNPNTPQKCVFPDTFPKHLTQSWSLPAFASIATLNQQQACIQTNAIPPQRQGQHGNSLTALPTSAVEQKQKFKDSCLVNTILSFHC